MTIQNTLRHHLHNESLVARALKGAGIALVFAIIFLSTIFLVGDVLNGKNFWQAAWEFFPLLTVLFGGALGGVVYYLLVQVWRTAGWKKILITIISILIYIVLMWLSLIVGFSATGQWD
jgi:hypothetical protein